MLHDELTVAPFEVKASTDGSGEFSGYGAVFGNRDHHDDLIRPGAFTASLTERKGRPLPMHLNHGLKQLGGRHHVGVWRTVTEDSKGLEVKGRVSGMGTDGGKMLFEQVRDGLFPGLSIGYRVKPGGAIYGVKSGEPRRTLTSVHLAEVSLVDDPSNADAMLTEIKSLIEHKTTAAPGKAIDAIASAMRLHQATTDGGNSPTADQRAQMLAHLQDAHEALTGSRTPDGWKPGMPAPAQVKAALVASGMSDEQAEQFASLGFKTAWAEPPASAAAHFAGFGGFSLPKL